MEEFPIPLENFAKLFAVEILYEDLPPDLYGYVDPSDPPKFIVIDRKLPLCEQHFTILHELMHIHCKHKHSNQPMVIDDHRMQFLRRFFTPEAEEMFEKRFTAEWQADAYALILLMNSGHAYDLFGYLRRHPKKIPFALYMLIVNRKLRRQLRGGLWLEHTKQILIRYENGTTELRAVHARVHTESTRH